MAEYICSHCGAIAAASRVTLHRKSWAGSPAPYLGGPWSDLQTLVAAGMAERLSSGWYIPTALCPLTA